MFERFTDRARKVMALANQEAQRFNHEYIDPAHILLGLVKEGGTTYGVGGHVLIDLGLDLKSVRLAVERVLKSGPETVTLGKLPQTPRTKKIIEYAIEEARNLNHNYVGTEHLLLALLRDETGEPPHTARIVLATEKVDFKAVRERVITIVGERAEQPDAWDMLGLGEQVRAVARKTAIDDLRATIRQRLRRVEDDLIEVVRKATQ